MYLVRPPYLLKNLYPKAIWRMDASQKKIYLTFDDGPVPEVTPWVLDVLKEKNVKALFFCVGENIETNPEIFQRIIDEGHQVGNHTYNHINGWNTSTDQYFQNIEKCEVVLRDLSSDGHPSPTGEGKGMGRLFRPPYGKLKTTQYSRLLPDYSIIMWDVLSADYDNDTSPEKCLSNSIDFTRNGSIIVFHDSIKAEKKLRYALVPFIDWALKEGFEFGSF